ncbi:MAG: phosphopyruvate hydratase [Firmicutes bacterium]|nr:phosphopyruvate hydratase [Bacillota bacterium]
MSDAVITDVRGFQIFDSRGWPTLAVEVELASGQVGLAMIPAGASTGTREARELRDGGPHFRGRGVTRSIQAIKEVIRPRVRGLDAHQQALLDRLLIELDNTPDKSHLGANTILGVSLATARAAAQADEVPLYRYWAGSKSDPLLLPTPQFNVINGGVHADSAIPVQEFLVIPGGASSFAEAMQMGTEIYHALGERLKTMGHRTAVGDEGGYAPRLTDIHQIFDVLLSSIDHAGFTPGVDVALGVDVAANSLRQGSHYRWYHDALTADDLINQYIDWIRQYPLVSIEDGLAEDDWRGWQLMTALIGERCQIVGDDIFVTQVPYVKRGIEERCANAVLIKLNQVGTVLETRQVVERATAAQWHAVVSHRSGETTDDAIADFAVAVGASQIKSGAPARGERLAKYNRLLLMEAHDATLRFAGWSWRRGV